MSWLTDFAGKAENFLNAMDKGAASALTGVSENVRRYSINNKSDETTSDSLQPDTEYIESPEIMSLKTSASNSSLYSGNGNNNGGKGHTRNSSYDSVGSRGSKVLDEERLIEFLNNKDIPEEEWRGSFEDSPPPVEDQHRDDGKLTKVNEVKIEALSKELTALSKRFTELTTEHKQLQRKAIGYHNQSATNEKLIKELRSRESDLLATINAKDSQIAALKVQLEEVNFNFKQRDEKCAELEQLNLQLNELLKSKSPEDEETVSGLERDISTLKQTLKEEREELRRVQEGNNQQLIRLEDNQRSLIEELENCRRQLAEVKSTRGELELTNASLERRLSSLEAEYSEFKLKANKTLQDKDEMIQLLNSRSDETLQQRPDSAGEQARLLQEQCDTLVKELTELRAKYDSTKALLEKAENESLPRQEYEIRQLKDELEQTTMTSQCLKSEVCQLSKESKSYQDDLNQMRTNLSARIAERDDEIEKLRKQLVLKQKSFPTTNGDVSPSNDASEWEQRLRTLNDRLIAKQSTVEQLSSANHSLKLQLERSEQRLRELANTNTSNDVSIGIYHSPNFTSHLIKHRISSNIPSDSVPLISDDPRDGNVTRNVKRAYGAIDAFSIRLGNFLRVYPSARAAFLVYIVILHIWVAFILIYYEPEIHSNDLNAL